MKTLSLLPLIALLSLAFIRVAEGTQSALFTLDTSQSPGINTVIKDLVIDSKARKKSDRCWSEVTVSYAGPKERRIESSHTNLPSMEENPVLTLELDPESPPWDRKIQLAQKCTYTRTDYNLCSDGNGGYTTCQSTITYDLKFIWDCDYGEKEVKKMKHAGGLGCKPSPNSQVDSHYINSKLTRKAIDEKFTQGSFHLNLQVGPTHRVASNTISHAQASGKKKVWIRFTEGITGHEGENDFVYHVTVDGHPFDISSNDGQLNYDLAYATDERTVKISVNAEEQDLIFDDSYVALKTLSLPTTRPGSGLIPLNRRTYFSEWFTPKNHQVLVIVTPDEEKLDATAVAAKAARAQQINDLLGPDRSNDGVMRQQTSSKIAPEAPRGGAETQPTPSANSAE